MMSGTIGGILHQVWAYPLRASRQKCKEMSLIYFKNSCIYIDENLIQKKHEARTKGVGTTNSKA